MGSVEFRLDSIECLVALARRLDRISVDGYMRVLTFNIIVSSVPPRIITVTTFVHRQSMTASYKTTPPPSHALIMLASSQLVRRRTSNPRADKSNNLRHLADGHVP